jgi:hypothetical protein
LQQIDNILYFTYTELVPKVLTVSNYNKLRQRNNIVVSERGGNGREVLVDASSLPTKYKELAKELICGGLEFGEYWLKSQIANWLPPIPAKDKQAIEKFRITREKSDFTEGVIETVDKEGLPPEAKAKYILQARWILLMKEGYHWHKKDLKRLDITSVEQFRKLCLTIANSKEVLFKANNYASFYRDKLKKYEQVGIVGLVNGRYGNPCARKITEISLQTLIDLYGVRTKPTTKKVTKAYNKIARAHGWDEVVEQTVYNNLHTPEIVQVWTLGRHGYEVWKRDYQVMGTRFRATMPNALWIGDDTKVNLYYMDKNGLKAHLQVYAIVDSHSGYWLGRTYAESRKGVSVDAEDVKNAFADSVEKSGGFMPFQMLYDNDGANNFYERLNTLHFPCMPYNGKSKYIERMFKKLQEEFMADDEAFTGMNIQSKTDQSKRVHVKGNKMAYANKEEAIKAQEMWFEIMNNTPDSNGVTPKDKYFGTINDEARKMTEYDAFEILYEWNERPITMTAGGVKMIHNKRDLYYDIIKDGQTDVAFYEENVKRVFRIKYNPRDLSKIALYSLEDRFINVAVSKQLIAEAVQDYRPEERKKIDELLTNKKTQTANISKKLATAKQVSDADFIIGNDGYKHHEKSVINQAEADMYTNRQEAQEVDEYLDIEKARRAMLHRKDRYNKN